MFDWPTFLALGARTQDHGAVMTLEARKMIVLVESSYPWSLGLTLLWHDGLLACGADQGEHSATSRMITLTGALMMIIMLS